MPKPATKSKKTPTKFYVTSEVFSSADLPSFIIEFCHKEKAVYRYKNLEKEVDPEELKRAQEIIREKKTMVLVNEEGEQKEIELDLISYDRSRWRHYFQPKSIEELTSFIEDSGFEFSLLPYNPNEEGQEEFEKYLEMEIGTPLPEEPVMLAKMMDSFMLDSSDEQCDCPSCLADREEDEEGDDEDE